MSQSEETQVPAENGAVAHAPARPPPAPSEELGEQKAMLRKILSRVEALSGLVNEVTMTPERLGGLRQTVLNLANIYLRTGNHEVRVAVKEIARGFCFVIGESHEVFFPDGPPKVQAPEPNAATVLPGAPGPGFPVAAQHTGMVAAVAAQHPAAGGSGISVPGMAPSPFAIPGQQNAQSAAHPVTGSPAAPGSAPLAPGESRMVVVSDPGGQMGPNGGPPAGTPATPGVIPGAPGAPVHPAVPLPYAPPAIPAQPPPGAAMPEMTLDQLAAHFSPMAQPAPPQHPVIDVPTGNDPSTS